MTDMIVGIDVSKAQLDVAVIPSNERLAAANDEDGCRELTAILKTLAPKLIVLEATGGLQNLVVGILVSEGLPVVVVNPCQVRDFAKACGKLAKLTLLTQE